MVVVLRGSAACAVAGIGLVAFGRGVGVLIPAVVLWGLGASLAFPITLSAAGDSGPDPAARVSLSALGCVAFLVEPPLLGALGKHGGLAQAVLVPMIAVALSLFLAHVVQPRRQLDPAATVAQSSKAS
ncbi:hypothetical protein [Kineococcus aurantiacus]|uniref:Cyanate permease n=1 Tax=Kineococcus aurantiacus TaxID=37633 RepID=A0A7Y9J3M4_9ACTN|nr:hypothetical protein [Kineococcus aurantiacus]NYD25148.1 cyanate permease [Kineococcus aurantiacus]